MAEKSTPRSQRSRSKSKGKSPAWTEPPSSSDPFSMQLQSLQVQMPAHTAKPSESEASSMNMSLASGRFMYAQTGHAAEIADDRSAVVPNMPAIWDEEPQMVTVGNPGKKRRVSSLSDQGMSQHSSKSSTGSSSSSSKVNPALSLLVQRQQVPDPTPLVEGGLVITMQPAEYGRFRYTKEGRNTPLHGRVEGKFPTVAVAPAFRHLIPDGTMINGTIVTRHMDSQGNPVPHWHVLEGRGGARVAQPVKNEQVEFKHLVVNRNTFEVHGVRTRQHTDDQQVIRLMFEAHFVDQSNRMFRTRVITDPIYGTELKIHKLSHAWIPAYEETEIFFLTSKIKKKNTSLRIIDPTPTAFRQDVLAAGWQLDEKNRPYFNVKKLYVHHQYAVGGRMPAYWDKAARQSRKVDIKLLDDEHKQESPAVPLVYAPLNVVLRNMSAKASALYGASAQLNDLALDPSHVIGMDSVDRTLDTRASVTRTNPVVPVSPNESPGGSSNSTPQPGTTTTRRMSPRDSVEAGWLLTHPQFSVEDPHTPQGRQSFDAYETFV